MATDHIIWMIRLLIRLNGRRYPIQIQKNS